MAAMSLNNNGPFNRLRGSCVEIPQDHDDDETQPPSQPVDDMDETNDDRQEVDNLRNDETVPTLDPSGLWFTNHSVSGTITDIIQNFYDGPYTCWKNAKHHAKERWWHDFQQSYQWDTKYAATVRVEFRKKAAERLRDLASTAGKKPSTEIIPWMSQDVRRMLIKVRSSPTFKRKSEQARANRKEGEKKGIKHSQGSISAAEILRREMAATGRLLSAPELFLRTHTKKDKAFVSDEAKKIWDDYLSEKATTEADGSSSTISQQNDCFFKATGGWKKKGTLFGLGNCATTYYQKPIKYSTNAESSTPTPGIAVQLEGKLEMTTSELTQTQEKLADAVKKIDLWEKEAQENRKLMLEMQTAMKQMSQVLKGSQEWSTPMSLS